MKLKFPGVYFGGKSAIAAQVWERLGNPPNYVEPFCGSAAVLLARPQSHCVDGRWPIETVNDINAWLCNVWRAIHADPDGVAAAADYPVSELDIHARGDWLFYRPGVMEWVEKLRSDPAFYDVKSAAWWIWGNSCWIGDNWSRSTHNARHHQSGEAIGVVHAFPHLGDAGKGINRQRPHLGNASHGVSRQRPHLGDAGQGINRKLPDPDGADQIGDAITDTMQGRNLREYMRQLYQRTRGWRVCCGDWTRVLGETPTVIQGMTGVFLDPPYGVLDRDTCYGSDDSRDVATDVLRWCLENGDNPLLRIALCGYAGEHDELERHGWDVLHWKGRKGYGSQRKDSVNENRKRERIWFSPACSKPIWLLNLSREGQLCQPAV